MNIAPSRLAPPTGPVVPPYPPLREIPFELRLAEANPKEVIQIGCIDYRQQALAGYHLTSAGAYIHSPMIDDLLLVLRGKRFLVLQGHTDCAKSAAETPPHAGERPVDYRLRVEQRTVQRLWAEASKLIDHPAVLEAIEQGLQFCVALHDLGRGRVLYFEEKTRALLEVARSRREAA